MSDRPVARRLFTADEYHRMLEVGILYSGEPVELLAGEICEAAPMGSRHAGCLRALDLLLADEEKRRWIVSTQCPVGLSDLSEPEPDIAVLAWRDDLYASAHPRPDDVLLLVEVSDTTYGHDRGRKLPLYAEASVREYWIVRLETDQIEVHLDPAGSRYRRLEIFAPGDSLSPRFAPGLRLAVTDLLR